MKAAPSLVSAFVFLAAVQLRGSIATAAHDDTVDTGVHSLEESGLDQSGQFDQSSALVSAVPPIQHTFQVQPWGLSQQQAVGQTKKVKGKVIEWNGYPFRVSKPAEHVAFEPNFVPRGGEDDKDVSDAPSRAPTPTPTNSPTPAGSLIHPDGGVFQVMPWHLKGHDDNIQQLPPQKAEQEATTKLWGYTFKVPTTEPKSPGEKDYSLPGGSPDHHVLPVNPSDVYAARHFQIQNCEAPLERINAVESNLVPRLYKLTNCYTNATILVSQVECKCKLGEQCAAKYMSKFWSNTTGGKSSTDGLQGTQVAYNAYLQGRDQSIKSILASSTNQMVGESQYSKASIISSLGAWPPEVDQKAWITPEGQVDAVDKQFRDMFVEALEKRFNEFQMAGKAYVPVSGQQCKVDYGSKATLGKGYYQDCFARDRFDARVIRESRRLPNCCARSCGNGTGYPVMWDQEATNMPVRVGASSNHSEHRSFKACPSLDNLPKDAHYVRIAPCFFEAWPICAVIKVTKSAKKCGKDSVQLRSWVKVSSSPGEPDLETKINSVRDELEKMRQNGEIPLAKRQVVEQQLIILKNLMNILNAADTAIRQVISSLRFEVVRSSVSEEACQGQTLNTNAVSHSGKKLYVKTVGKCVWGRSWGEKGLRDCIGNLNNEECEAACSAKAGCGAYERVDTVNNARCCLFTYGSFGNMVQETPDRVCWVKPWSKPASCRELFQPGNTVSFRAHKNEVSWCSLGAALTRAPTRTPTTVAPTTASPTTAAPTVWVNYTHSSTTMHPTRSPTPPTGAPTYAPTLNPSNRSNSSSNTTNSTLDLGELDAGLFTSTLPAEDRIFCDQSAVGRGAAFEVVDAGNGRIALKGGRSVNRKLCSLSSATSRGYLDCEDSGGVDLSLSVLDAAQQETNGEMTCLLQSSENKWCGPYPEVESDPSTSRKNVLACQETQLKTRVVSFQMDPPTMQTFGVGYCMGGKGGSTNEPSLDVCKQRCIEDEFCMFAAFSTNINSTKLCYLYNDTACELNARTSYHTYKKMDPIMLPAPAVVSPSLAPTIGLQTSHVVEVVDTQEELEARNRKENEARSWLSSDDFKRKSTMNLTLVATVS